jgi:exopolysaccharide biosynthesis polyprenyl glycosylphosphotransferase
MEGVRVDEAVGLYERFSEKIWVERLDSEWFVYAGVHRSRASLAAKRFLDVVFAVLLIVLTAPLMALIAAAIRLNSRGPALFRQLRVGLHGKSFFIYKFRSMYENAERKTGPVWASAGDKRVTPVGRILRRFRLDEIPQAFNVLRGEMSMIGPRPERPYFVDELAKQIPFYAFRHRVKPGITGWAQVMYRYGDSFEDALEKLKYDFYYVEHGSFWCDLRILMKTVRIVLVGGGQ